MAERSNELNQFGLVLGALEPSEVTGSGFDGSVVLYASGSAANSKLYYKGPGGTQRNLGFDITDLTEKTSDFADADVFGMADAGESEYNERKVTFANYATHLASATDGGIAADGSKLKMDISDLGTAATPANGDHLAFQDADGSDATKRMTLQALASLYAGAGMTATNSVMNVIGGDGITANANDVAVTAAQTTITSVKNNSLVVGRASGDDEIDFSSAGSVVVKTNDVARLTVADAKSTFSTAVEMADNLEVKGNLYVSGTLTTIDTDNLRIEDALIELNSGDGANTRASNANAGLYITGSVLSNDVTFKVVSDGGRLRASDGLDVASGKDYAVAGTSVLNASTLGSSVVDSSLQNLGVQDAALDMGDQNISNVGDIDADSLSIADAAQGLKIDASGANDGTFEIIMENSDADALSLKTSAADYIVVNTSTPQIAFKQNSTFNGTTIADLGTVSAATSITSTNFVGALDGVVGGNTPAAGTFTSLVANGNVDLGDATSDTITATGRFDSDLVPSGDSARALGSSTLQWSAIHVDVGHIDQLGSALDCNSQAMTNVNIDGGAIDATVIGANTKSSAALTTLLTTGLATLASARVSSLSAGTAGGMHPLVFNDEDKDLGNSTSCGLVSTTLVNSGSMVVHSLNDNLDGIAFDIADGTRVAAMNASGLTILQGQSKVIDFGNFAGGSQAKIANGSGGSMLEMSSSAGISLKANGASGANNIITVDVGGNADNEAIVVSNSKGIKAAFFRQNSDINLKKDVEKISNSTSLDKVLSLEPVSYKFKSTNMSDIGFIAQDVAKIVPEICGTDEKTGEGRSIDYSKLTTLLAGAVQQQQVQINDLKEIIAKLQK